MNLDTWIGRELEKLPFVEWDRYTLNRCDKGQFTRVYGWIERGDEYKDFVVLDFLHWSREAVFICTSSAECSERIQEILYGDADDHVECQRVENRFDIANAIDNPREV